MSGSRHSPEDSFSFKLSGLSERTVFVLGIFPPQYSPSSPFSFGTVRRRRMNAFLEKLARIIHEETDVGIASIRTHQSKAPFLAYSGIKAQVLAKWLYVPGDLMLERKAMLAREFGTWELSKFGWMSRAVMTPRMREILER